MVLHSQAKVVKLARKSIFRSYICPVLMFHLRYHLRNCTFDNNVATSSAGAIIIGGQAIVDLDGAVFTNVSNFISPKNSIFPTERFDCRTKLLMEVQFKLLWVRNFI